MWRPPCVVMPPTQLKHWLWSVSLMLQKNEKTLPSLQTYCTDWLKFVNM
jgi:hypothetical protein